MGTSLLLGVLQCCSLSIHLQFVTDLVHHSVVCPACNSQQFHSTVRSSRTRFWNEWLGSVTSLSRRAPRLACSLIRRTFRSSGVTPDLCHMQWHGPSCSAPTGDSPFSDDFFHSVSLHFASLTSLRESGRFDAPFSYNELVAALSKCHESALGADCLPYSFFKVSFPWWRHLLLSFFNLVLRLSLVPSAWRSSLVVPVIKRDGDPTSLDSYRPSLASCAFKLFEHLIYARIAPHIFPQLDPSQGGFRWGADAILQPGGHLAPPPSRAHLCRVHRH